MSFKSKALLISAILGAACALPAAAMPINSISNTVKAISDNSTVSSTINFANHGKINGLTISVGVSHSWIGDLVYTLTHGAESIVLMSRNGLNERNGNQTLTAGYAADLNSSNALVFGDSASQSASTAGRNCDNGTLGVTAACKNLYFKPLEALSTFSHDDIFGAWTLTISDKAQQDVGQLSNWSLSADVNNVPEPGSLAILGLGLAGLAFAGRRKS